LLLGAHDFGGTTLPCFPAPNKHTYFTIWQLVESAFRTSTWAFSCWKDYSFDYHFNWKQRQKRSL